MTLLPCIGCGALFHQTDGPTHPYMESSPACWATYGEVLAREYSDPSFFEVHGLSVDAYAVQHPGRPSPQSVQSVALHLIRLSLTFERGLDSHRAHDAMAAATRQKEKFVWLTPPPNRGSITVAEVHRAQSASEHLTLVRSWAKSAWLAWSSHHSQIQAWLPPEFI